MNSPWQVLWFGLVVLIIVIVVALIALKAHGVL